MEPRELFNAFVLGDLNEWARRAEMNQEGASGRGMHVSLSDCTLFRTRISLRKSESSTCRFGFGHPSDLRRSVCCGVFRCEAPAHTSHMAGSRGERTVYRTVAGAIEYHKVLEAQLREPRAVLQSRAATRALGPPVLS